MTLHPALLDLSLDQVESDAHSVVLVQECLRLYVIELGQLGVQSLVLLYLNLLRCNFALEIISWAVESKTCITFFASPFRSTQCL